MSCSLVGWCLVDAVGYFLFFYFLFSCPSLRAGAMADEDDQNLNLEEVDPADGDFADPDAKRVVPKCQKKGEESL